jgi:ABC-type phosphonate transport system ATPase subunit
VTSTEATPLLEIAPLTKRYGEQIALDSVGFTIRQVLGGAAFHV